MDNKFRLSWEAFEKNIGSSLASLQQSGEFVDMTLAADGHLVKVHQLVMSLASHYIKDLIKSSQSQHPVVFLHKISYSTLCSILEYIYTGEVTVTENNLKDLLDACKVLHIKGLEDMEVQQSFNIAHIGKVNCNISIEKKQKQDGSAGDREQSDDVDFLTDEEIEFVNSISSDEDTINAPVKKGNIDDQLRDKEYSISDTDNEAKKIKKFYANKSGLEHLIQYSVSNQGGLQLVLNRYLYNLRHTSKKVSGVRRQWRCVKYSSIRCAATVITMNNVIEQRKLAHTHSYSDSAILKKDKAGSVFTAIEDAEKCADKLKRKQRQKKNIN